MCSRRNTKRSFKEQYYRLENQLRFAKEAVLRLHDDKGIVHGSLWVLFWKLTNHKTPFEGLDDEHITCKILNGVREEPVQTRMLNLLDFIKVKYWEQEPDECLNIFQVNSVLNNIDSENINMLIVPENEKKETAHSWQIDLSDSQISADVE
ncbi:kinase-like domain-containing protein [Rhizophagus clarus]|uniref:Kinase-like domain-containing protein n=1 Tax=Rhizophagus clarus TaxID=94130 RepID=A0A8H3M4I2_9GLOM|nr:kinase-like domain-containing protein [Rhizophagus clarus]